MAVITSVLLVWLLLFAAMTLGHFQYMQREPEAKWHYTFYQAVIIQEEEMSPALVDIIGKKTVSQWGHQGQMWGEILCSRSLK